MGSHTRGIHIRLCCGRQRNVLKKVMHVQSCCFVHKTNCFLTFSLSSWMLELSNIDLKLTLIDTFAFINMHNLGAENH